MVGHRHERGEPNPRGGESPIGSLEAGLRAGGGGGPAGAAAGGVSPTPPAARTGLSGTPPTFLHPIPLATIHKFTYGRKGRPPSGRRATAVGAAMRAPQAIGHLDSDCFYVSAER